MVALRRGEDSDEAFVGALLEADYQSWVRALGRAFLKPKD